MLNDNVGSIKIRWTILPKVNEGTKSIFKPNVFYENVKHEHSHHLLVTEAKEDIR